MHDSRNHETPFCSNQSTESDNHGKFFDFHLEVSHTDLKCFQELGMTSQESHSQLVTTVAKNVELIGHQWSSDNLANFPTTLLVMSRNVRWLTSVFNGFHVRRTCVFRLYLEQNITNKLPISNITSN